MAPGRIPMPVTEPIAAPEPAPIAPPVTARSPQVLPHAVALNRTVVIRISLIVVMVVSEGGYAPAMGLAARRSPPQARQVARRGKSVMDWHAVNGRIAGTLLRRRSLSLCSPRVDRRLHRSAKGARRRASVLA